MEALTLVGEKVKGNCQALVNIFFSFKGSSIPNETRGEEVLLGHVG